MRINVLHTLKNKGSLVLMVLLKNLQHPRNLSIAQKTVYSEKELSNVLYTDKKWFFQELFSERVFGEPKMLFVWHCKALLKPLLLWPVHLLLDLMWWLHLNWICPCECLWRQTALYQSSVQAASCMHVWVTWTHVSFTFDNLSVLRVILPRYNTEKQ